MPENNILLNIKNRAPDWVTIREAVKIANKKSGSKIKHADIYRHVLYGDISLSIYFQSPITLRKIQFSGYKVKLRPVGESLIHQLCHLEKNCFLNERNLIVSTSDKHITPVQRIIDTSLAGYEYVLIQRLLAHSLKIPLPVTGATEVNYGITVSYYGEIYQVVDKITWNERIKHQIMQLPENIVPDIDKNISHQRINRCLEKDYFPVHNFPQDAWFVIRHAEVEKLINILIKDKTNSLSSTRISTPLSRLFWLACKNNETISPLLNHPYKLLSIFEQWASADGITDHLSGDTLKKALERGSPSSTSLSN